MLEYYPTLLEASVEFKIYSRQILADFKSKNFIIFYYGLY